MGFPIKSFFLTFLCEIIGIFYFEWPASALSLILGISKVSLTFLNFPWSYFLRHSAIREGYIEFLLIMI